MIDYCVGNNPMRNDIKIFILNIKAFMEDENVKGSNYN